MNKTMYFGEVPKEYLDQSDTDELFQYQGKFYYYELTFNFSDGCAQLRDTCNRMMPFDYTTYDEMVVAFQAMATLQDSYNCLKVDMEKFESFIPSTLSVPAI